MKKNIYLSLFSGLLLWLAWPPMQYTSFLLFGGLVPMLLAIENIIKSDVGKKGKRIFWTTFTGFLLWNFLSIYWVYNALKDIGEIAAIPVSLIPYGLAPLLMSGACWLYYRFRLVTNRGWGLLGFAIFWVGYEYLHQNWELNFPWMTLGNGLASTHQWVQWYEYTGVYGGTLWILSLNILIFLVYIGFKEAHARNRQLYKLAGLLLLLAGPIAWSLNRYANYKEQVDPSNIVVAQPNIDPYAKMNSMAPGEQITTLIKLSDSLAQTNTEFFIWPETAISAQSDEDHIRSNPYFEQIQRFLRKYKNGNVVSGLEGFKVYNNDATATARPFPQGTQYYDSFNSAINIENSAEVQIYHKSKLVPGAEAMPFSKALSFLKPVFAHLGGAAGSYGSDDNVKVLYAQSGIGVDPVICYESIYGEWVGKAVKSGAQFIAVITNDGWWGNTSGKDQHLAYAKLRAIETRRWVCRSANTGISAFINQRGDVVSHTGWWQRTALKQNINLNSDITFYVQHGDYIPKMASVLGLIAVLFLLTRWWITRKKRVEVKP